MFDPSVEVHHVAAHDLNTLGKSSKTKSPGK
jgi:hypothetical protein